jgi:hypothetical protein
MVYDPCENLERDEAPKAPAFNDPQASAMAVIGPKADMGSRLSPLPTLG